MYLNIDSPSHIFVSGCLEWTIGDNCLGSPANSTFLAIGQKANAWACPIWLASSKTIKSRGLNSLSKSSAKAALVEVIAQSLDELITLWIFWHKNFSSVSFAFFHFAYACISSLSGSLLFNRINSSIRVSSESGNRCFLSL